MTAQRSQAIVAGRMAPQLIALTWRVVMTDAADIVQRSGGVLLPHLRGLCAACRFLYPVPKGGG